AALAATRSGTIAECGTGCGVGAAWLRSGARAGTRVITAELDGELAHSVMDMFADDEIDVFHADWTTLADHAPFSLLFLDAGSAKSAPRDDVLALLEPGGMVVLDDFAPTASWPPLVDGRVDVVRQEWLSDARMTGVDVMVAEDTAVIIAVRRGRPRAGHGSAPFGSRPVVLRGRSDAEWRNAHPGHRPRCRARGAAAHAETGPGPHRDRSDAGPGCRRAGHPRLAGRGLGRPLLLVHHRERHDLHQHLDRPHL